MTGGSGAAGHCGIATAATVLGGVAAAAPAGYLAMLSLAALGARADDTIRSRPALRLAVLVPAHDEEVLVGRCVDTLLAQDYPRDLVRVVVVADNCTDSTAEVARARGAEVLERTDAVNRGKGHALNWAMATLGSAGSDIDAFVVVDADSITEPGLLRALATAAEAGASVVQADYGALVEGTDDRAQLRAAAFLLFHRVRFSGKARLGLPCSLVGNGMLFTRQVVAEHPWTAFSEVEDLEYSLVLREAGVRPVFAPEGRLTAPVASAGAAADVQRARWEGGRMRLVRRRLPALAREVVTGRRPDLWDAAADLAVPPLGVLAVGIVAGTAGALALRATGVVPTAAVVPWLVAAAAVPAHVIVGLRAADAPPEMAAALRAAPALVAGEARTRLTVMTGRDAGEWVRTPRPTLDPDAGPASGSADR